MPQKPAEMGGGGGGIFSQDRGSLPQKEQNRWMRHFVTEWDSLPLKKAQVLRGGGILSLARGSLPWKPAEMGEGGILSLAGGSFPQRTDDLLVRLTFPVVGR